MKNIEKYIKSFVGTPVDYDGVYGHQCVDLVKDFSAKILGVKLGTFGGSAKAGWENKSKTFDLRIWEKLSIKNELQVGDLLFHTKDKYGHTAIFLENIGNGKIKILEQNAGTGTGKGKSNFVKISEVTKNTFEGFFRKKGFKVEKTEFQKLIDEAVALGIFNGKDIDKPATRGEVALMCLAVLKIFIKRLDNLVF